MDLTTVVPSICQTGNLLSDVLSNTLTSDESFYLFIVFVIFYFLIHLFK